MPHYLRFLQKRDIMDGSPQSNQPTSLVCTPGSSTRNVSSARSLAPKAGAVDAHSQNNKGGANSVRLRLGHNLPGGDVTNVQRIHAEFTVGAQIVALPFALLLLEHSWGV
jgi:hypothetical protein